MTLKKKENWGVDKTLQQAADLVIAKAPIISLKQLVFTPVYSWRQKQGECLCA